MANETTLNMTLLLRRAAFTDSCILAAGEPGCFLDLNADGSLKANSQNYIFKVGDGKTAWKDLPIANQTQIEAWIKAVDDKVKALNDTFATDTELAALDTAIQTLLGAFPIGEGDDKYANIKAYIDAKDAATLASAQGYADTKKIEVIGTNDTATELTVRGVKQYAKEQTEAISDKLGTIAEGDTISELIAANAQAAADAASAAASAGTAATNAQNTIAGHKNDKANPHGVTAAQVGLDKVENKSTATIKTEFTGAIADGNTGFVTGDAVYEANKAITDKIGTVSTGKTVVGLINAAQADASKALTDLASEVTARENADNALDERIDKLEAFFEGADHDGEDGGLKDALDTLVEIQDYITTEGAAADQMVKDIKQNADDIDALETRMGTAEEEIDAIQADLDTATTGLKARMATAESEIDDLQAKVSTGTNSHETRIGAIETALRDGGTTYEAIEVAQGAADDAQDAIDAHIADKNNPHGVTAAQLGVAAFKDKTLATSVTQNDANAVTGGAVYTAVKAATDAAAAADAKATSAGTTATNAQAAITAHTTDKENPHDVTKAQVGLDKVENKSTAEIKSEFTGAIAENNDKFVTGGAVHTAIEDAKNSLKGEANDAATAETIAGAKKYADGVGTSAVSSANSYTDTSVAAVHEGYGTGTVKDAAHDSATDPSFITSISIEKGHVTGATVQNLKAVLENMIFVIDGGTEGGTISIL